MKCSLAIGIFFILAAIADSGMAQEEAFINRNERLLTDFISESVSVDSEAVVDNLSDEGVAGDDPVIFVDDNEVTSQNISDSGEEADW